MNRQVKHGVWLAVRTAGHPTIGKLTDTALLFGGSAYSTEAGKVGGINWAYHVANQSSGKSWSTYESGGNEFTCQVLLLPSEFLK